MTDIAAPLRARIIAQAGNRCGYCRAHQQYVYDTLHIEHITPRVRGGSNEEANLWLACGLCNRAKREQTHGRDPVTGRRCASFTRAANSGSAISNGARMAQKSSDVPCVVGRRWQHCI